MGEMDDSEIRPLPGSRGQAADFVARLTAMRDDLDGADPFGDYLLAIAVAHFSAAGPRPTGVTPPTHRHPG